MTSDKKPGLNFGEKQYDGKSPCDISAWWNSNVEERHTSIWLSLIGGIAVSFSPTLIKFLNRRCLWHYQPDLDRKWICLGHDSVQLELPVTSANT